MKMRFSRSRFVGVCLLIIAALTMTTVLAANASKVLIGSFGGEGLTGVGGTFNNELQSPRGVAVNQTTGNVYVADLTNARIQEFNPKGEWIRAWGWGVISPGGHNLANAQQMVAVSAESGTYTLTAATAIGTGTTTSGSDEVTGVTTTTGAFHAGDAITASAGIPSGTIIGAVGVGTLTLSANATATGGRTLTATETTANISWNAPATGSESVQSKLAALAGVGGGDITVAGGPGNATASTPYTVTFTGTLGHAAQTTMTANSASLVGSTHTTIVTSINTGGTGFEVCDSAAVEPNAASECKAGVAGGGDGQLSGPNGVAINQETGNVYVSEANQNRISEFGPSGNFIRAWGQGVVSAGPDIPAPAPTSAVQTVTVTAEGGVYTLTFDGQTTGPLAYNATAAEVKSALGALGTIGAAGNVTVTGGPGDAIGSNPYVVTFAGSLANTVVPQMIANATGLTGTTHTAVVAITTTGISAFEVCNPSVDVCKAGVNGQGNGGFGTVGKLAVDPATGNVLFADAGNRRVQMFTANGSFVEALGWGVDATAGGASALQVCQKTEICLAGLTGSGIGQFAASSPSAVAVDSSDNVYAVDFSNSRTEKFVPTGGTPEDPASFAASEFGPSGSSATPFGVAIDPANNHILIGRRASGGTTEMQVAEYDQAGTLLETHGVGAKIGEGSNNNVTTGALAVESSAKGGNIYVATAANSGNNKVYILSNPTAPTPTINNVAEVTVTSAKFSGTVNPNGFPGGYHFEYSTNGVTWTNLPSSDVSVGGGKSAVTVEQAVVGLEPNKLYKVRLRASDTGTPSITATSEEKTFTTLAAKPLVTQTLASPVEETGADLTAYVNPNNADTTYHIEYGTTTSYGHMAPGFERHIGSGGTAISVVESISNLLPDTEYHFRVTAANTTGGLTGTGVTDGADETFTTRPAGEATGDCPNEAVRRESNINTLHQNKGGQLEPSPFSSQLPECRAYEMVTPLLKGGSHILSSVSTVRTVDLSGGALSLSATAVWPASEEAGDNNYAQSSAVEAVEYTLARGAGDWTFTPHEPSASALRWFTSPGSPASEDVADGSTVLVGRGYSPSEEYNIGKLSNFAVGNLYLLGAHGGLSEIGPSVPLAALGQGYAGRLQLSNTSIDGSRALFKVTNEAPKAHQNSFWSFDSTNAGNTGSLGNPESLYEYVGVCGSTAICDESITHREPSLVGVDNTGQLISQCGILPGSLEESEGNGNNAMSDLGSTVFFTAVKSFTACNGGIAPSHNELFARIGKPGKGVELGDTVTVNVAGVGVGSPTLCSSDACGVTGDVVYQGASTDGSKVFFTTAQKLTGVDIDAGIDIYECKLPGDSGPSLERSTNFVNPCPELVPVSVTGTTSAADVQNVVAISRNGSHVYFTAGGVLTGTNAEGYQPVSGAHNLYVWEEPSSDHPQGRTVFVATLPSSTLTEAQATPSGNAFVFTSTADLTPDDTSTNVAQVFLYNATQESLIRVSRGQNGYNSNGNTATLPATIPPAENPNGNRTISDDGTTVAFQSSMALTPEVHGGLNNVYVWHDGNVSLLSDGVPREGSTGTGLAGMDSSGRNVFFVTAAKLVGKDTDELGDVYDARIGGGFTAPVIRECSGEGCQGQLVSVPLLTVIGSGGFPTEGNVQIATEMPAKSKPKPNPLTRAQKLARALKACQKDMSKRKRAACENQTRKKYRAKPPAKQRGQKSSLGAGTSKMRGN